MRIPLKYAKATRKCAICGNEFGIKVRLNGTIKSSWVTCSSECSKKYRKLENNKRALAWNKKYRDKK